jgi:hypothetical protein
MRVVGLSAVVTACAIATGIAGAVPKLPAPGAAATIAKQVAASVKLQKLPTSVAKQLLAAPNDNAALYYPQTKAGCLKLSSCVFGNKRSTHVLVVMGDSHAQMWIPALARIGTAKDLKVIVLYLARCPAATLDVWLTAFNTSYTQCTSQRTTWIAAIDKLHPMSVVLTDHANGVYTAASSGTQPFTSAAWQAGMQTTIASLAPSKAKLAILGDTNTFDLAPPQCLAAYPTNVQGCSAPNPNPDRPGQIIAEKAAATASGKLYVDPNKWLCTSTLCAPIIGGFIVNYDAFHLSCKYAAYLSGVLQTALRKVL